MSGVVAWLSPDIGQKINATNYNIMAPLLKSAKLHFHIITKNNKTKIILL